MSAPIRVVLVDDQQLIRVGFRRILETESDIEVVGEAANGAEALDVVRWRRPDVVLMDIQMPTMDGLEATRRLLAAPAAPRVIILTTFEIDEYVFEALRAGASGFLIKNAPPEDLVAAIRSVVAGGALAITQRHRPGHRNIRASTCGRRRRPPDRGTDRTRARGPGPGRARPVEPGDRREPRRR